MAQAEKFYSSGGMEIVKDRDYTKTDLPTIGTSGITKISLCEAPIIWRDELKEDGSNIKNDDGTNSRIEGNQRGVWILITRTTAGTTYGAGVDKNAPILVKEGEGIEIHDDNIYRFLQACRINHGNI